MIYKYTKCESVIAKILADLDSTEVQQRTSDIREWIFEAVEKIGAPVQYIQRESGLDGCPTLKIIDRQVPLPDDLVHLDGVAYSDHENGPWIPVRKSTALFHNQPKHKPHHIECTEHKEECGEIKDKSVAALLQLYGNGLNKYYESTYTSGRVNEPEYILKPGWLALNRDKGFIKLAYKAIPTDERGYPLIPDNATYQEAVYWYVVMKLSFPKWLNGGLGGASKYAQKYAANTYQFVQQQWHFYRNKAYAEAIMPTADDMKNIKREWNRLMPEYETDEYFFKHLNDEQTIYNDYYYGY